MAKSEYRRGEHPNSKRNLRGVVGTREAALKAWETRRARYGKTGNREPAVGRYVTAEGYAFVKRPNHPNADQRGYVREHVLVMSESLGRPMAPDEVVHHIDGDRANNRIENLEVMSRGEHHSLHHKGLRKPASLANLERMTSDRMKAVWDSGVRDQNRATPHTCDSCGSEFFGWRPPRRRKYCDRQCFQDHRKTGFAPR